jgi:hypothetical protein
LAASPVGSAESSPSAKPPSVESRAQGEFTKSELERAVLDVKDKPIGDEFLELLRRLGFGSSNLQDTREARVSVAERLSANLDGDPDEEVLLRPELRGLRAENPQIDVSATYTNEYLAWLKNGNGVLAVVGKRDLRLGSCLLEGGLSLSLERVHAQGFKDTVLRWADAPQCDGNYSSTDGTEVITLERGVPQRILEHRARYGMNRMTQEVTSEAEEIRFSGKAPRVREVVVGGRVKERRGFDPKVFTYDQPDTKSVALATRGCFAKVEGAKREVCLVLVLGPSSPPMVRWQEGRTVRYQEPLPEDQFDAEVFLTKQWNVGGSHRACDDNARDQAIVLVHPGTKESDLERAVVWLSRPQRVSATYCGKTEDSYNSRAFDVVVGSVDDPALLPLGWTPPELSGISLRYVALEPKELTVSGQMALEAVRSALGSSSDRFKLCYQAALVKNPEVTGKVQMRFVIGADGQVSKLEPEDSGYFDPAVGHCMEDAVGVLRFPVRKLGLVVVRASWELRTGE